MLLRKGREQYEVLVVTHRAGSYEDFIGIFSSYDEIYEKVNKKLFECGITTVWQMNAGEQLGKGIFDFDMGMSSKDYIV